MDILFYSSFDHCAIWTTNVLLYLQGVYSDLMDCQLDRKMIARLDSTKHNCVSVTHLLWHTVLIYWIYCINQLFRCVFQVETHKITLGIQNSENPKFAKKWVGHLKSKLYFGNYLGNFRNPKLWKPKFLAKKVSQWP